MIHVVEAVEVIIENTSENSEYHHETSYAVSADVPCSDLVEVLMENISENSVNDNTEYDRKISSAADVSCNDLVEVVTEITPTTSFNDNTQILAETPFAVNRRLLARDISDVRTRAIRSPRYIGDSTLDSCAGCNSDYTRKYSLLKHILRVDLKGGGGQGAIKHRIHFSCADCNRVYKRKYSLLKHIKRIHLEGGQKRQGEIKLKKTFSCADCNHVYTRKHSLLKHIKKNHLERRQGAIKQKKTFSCADCNRVYTRKYSLLKHLKKNHFEGRQEVIKQKKIFSCADCNSEYKKKCSLLHHIKRIHLKEEHGAMKHMKNYMCFWCQKSYKCEEYFRAHLKIKHNVDQVLLEFQREKFVCADCDKIFVSKRNLRVHIRKIHSLSSNKRNFQGIKTFKKGRLLKKCPLCSYNSEYEYGSCGIIEHFIERHGYDLNPKVFFFKTFECFKKWQGKFEDDTICRFVLRQRYKRGAGVIHVFRCHRSGSYNARGTGKKFLKLQGSKKINAFCPAQIQLLRTSNGEYKVQLIDIHVGHENELCHISLPKNEAKILAEKLVEDVASVKSIQDAPQSIKNSRLTLLNSQNVGDEKCDFNLHSVNVRFDDTDAESLEMWVSSNQDKVLLCKFGDSSSAREPTLKNDDFVLIIMDNVQKEMLQKFTKIIFVDTTYCTYNYDILLTTIMVVDEYHEGFPVAFMFTSRMDEDTLAIFFKYVKNRAGAIQAEAFMSDIAAEFYAAWEKIMPKPAHQLFCTWHVLGDWKDNLHKIKSVEERKNVYQNLSKALKELDYAVFEEEIAKFLKNPEEPEKDRSKYIEYFVTYYWETVDKWAYCYRFNLGINTNVITEAFRRFTKYVISKGNACKRIDDAINTIEIYLATKIRERKLISLKGGKLSYQIKSIRRNHRRMIINVDKTRYNTTSIIPEITGWRVPSFETHSNEMICEEYFIAKNSKCNNSCKLTCPACNICIHQLTCTCREYAIKFTMCQHIHLVATVFKNDSFILGGKLIESPPTSLLEYDDDLITDIIILPETFEDVSPATDNYEQLQNLKTKTIEKFCEIVNSCQTKEEVEALTRCVPLYCRN